MARKARKTNDRKQKTRTSATAGKTTSESSAKNNPTAAKAQAMPASNPKKKAATAPETPWSKPKKTPGSTGRTGNPATPQTTPAQRSPAPTAPPRAEAKTVAAAKPSVALEPKGAPSHDHVAEAAYYIWLERGGGELENWLEAESRLRQHAAATTS